MVASIFFILDLYKEIHLRYCCIGYNALKMHLYRNERFWFYFVLNFVVFQSIDEGWHLCFNLWFFQSLYIVILICINETLWLLCWVMLFFQSMSIIVVFLI